MPRTKRILKILLPTMLPTAISALPRSAAFVLVTSSGRLVPNATTVRPITLSLTPMYLAMTVALSTAASPLPKTMAVSPMMTQNSERPVLSGACPAPALGFPSPFFRQAEEIDKKCDKEYP